MKIRPYYRFIKYVLRCAFPHISIFCEYDYSKFKQLNDNNTNNKDAKIKKHSKNVKTNTINKNVKDNTNSNDIKDNTITNDIKDDAITNDLKDNAITNDLKDNTSIKVENIKKADCNLRENNINLELQNFSEEPAVFISNHSMAYSPIAFSLYFNKPQRTWIAAPMMDYKTAPKYAYEDFWGNKKHKLYYKFLGFLSALMLVPLMRGEKGIAVYKDMRIKETFGESLETLNNGQNIIIFPEKRQKYSKFINELQDGFVDLAHIYYKQSGKYLKFYPCYTAPTINSINIGKPIIYNPLEDRRNERQIITKYLKTEITKIAESLPEHKIIPYSYD